jgi:hypothetical protein
MGLKKITAHWLCIFFLVMPACVADAQSKEYQIKAAFLFNFAQFVDWPSAVFANTNAPFSIGILGDDPFGGALDETIQGETINNHKIIVVRSQQVEDLKNCQIIFVGKSEKKHVAEILSELDSRPILTVSEIDGFAERGGEINFFLAGTKVRFEINPAVAQNDGLKISSQLLSLGKIVESTKEGK